MADFCAEAPERRAGIAQIFLGNIEGSVAEIEWAREHGLRGGVLLPGAPPGSGLPPLYAPEYEPIWAACESLGMPVNHHSGGAVPQFGPYLASMAMFMVEVTWWGHRGLWHLIFGGVFERHPNLHFVNTESGSSWVLDTLPELDQFYERMKYGDGSESVFGGMVVKNLSLRPSEYYARQCHLGSSFLRPIECAMRHQIGVDKIMWGDYPHVEGSFPYTTLSISGAPSPGWTRTRSRVWSAATRPSSTASTSTPSRPLPRNTGPRSARCSKPSHIQGQRRALVGGERHLRIWEGFN